MTLAELTEVAFKRGVGISRSYALRSARYKELCETYVFSERVDYAEMVYLGERLADRAFRNLPKFIREQAPRWTSMTADEQLKFAEAIANALQGQAHPTQAVSGKNLDMVAKSLPHEFGSWTHGAMQPNCLGLAQMLIGFARATGAEHRLCTPVLLSQEYAERYFLRATANAIETLEAYQELAPIRRILRGQRKQYRSSLDSLARMQRDQLAHHGLLIRMSNDHWLLLDPYMLQLVELEDFAVDNEQEMEGGVCLTISPMDPGRVQRDQKRIQDFAESIRNPRRPLTTKSAKRIDELPHGRVDRKRYLFGLETSLAMIGIQADYIFHQEPPTYETTHPAMGLSFAMLNHLSVHMGRRQTDLVYVQSSQHIVRDQLLVQPVVDLDERLVEFFIEVQAQGAHLLPEISAYLATHKKRK